jgi:hypothetical protein
MKNKVTIPSAEFVNQTVVPNFETMNQNVLKKRSKSECLIGKKNLLEELYEERKQKELLKEQKLFDLESNKRNLDFKRRLLEEKNVDLMMEKIDSPRSSNKGDNNITSPRPSFSSINEKIDFNTQNIINEDHINEGLTKDLDDLFQYFIEINKNNKVDDENTKNENDDKSKENNKSNEEKTNNEIDNKSKENEFVEIDLNDYNENINNNNFKIIKKEIVKKLSSRNLLIYKENVKIEFENNDKYEGIIINDQFNDEKGIYYFNNGDYYIGNFKNNKFNGKGVIFYNDGSKFEGEFVNNKKNGFGVFYENCDFMDSDKFEGFWKNNLKNGEFVVFKKNSKHCEIWENDKKIY